MVVVDLRLADGARLHHRLHGRRPRLHALLLVHLAVHVLDAHAGDEQQLRAAVLRLGGGRSGLVPADRLLVHAADGDPRQPEGVPGQPRRRLRLRARASASSSPTSARWTTRRCSPAPTSSPNTRVAAWGRNRVVADDDDLHLPVHRRDGQERAGAAARLAARLDGRPDADLGADPRGDDGDGGHLHGRADEPAVRAVRDGAVVRHRGRRDDGAVHGVPRHRPERHQAGGRVLDAVAAGLHDRRARRVGVLGGDLPPDDARVLQGAAVPRRRLGHHRAAPRAGPAQDGRAAPVHADHLDHGAVVGSLALAGIPPFAGFFSKDAIIEAVHLSKIPGHGYAYFAVMAGVFITAFYSFRMLFLAFHGKPRFDVSGAHGGPGDAARRCGRRAPRGPRRRRARPRQRAITAARRRKARGSSPCR